MIRFASTLMFFLLLSDAYAGNLHTLKEKGKIIYTNISNSSFFSNAFKLAKSNHINKDRIIQLIKKKAYKFDLDPKVAIAIAKIESSLNNNAISKSGAIGIMQLKQKTAEYYGVRNINDMEQNIEGGIRFLKHLTTKYKKLELVAAAYNAGETAVDKSKGIPPIAETRRYVKKFLNAYYNKPKSTPVKSRIVHKTKIFKIGNRYTNIRDNLW